MPPALLAAVARSVSRRRSAWVLATLLLATCAAWGASRLTLRLDLRDFVPDASEEEGPALPDGLSEVPGGDPLAIVLEGDDSIPTEDVRRVFEHLTAGLVAVEGMGRIEARRDPAIRRFLEEELPPRILLYLAPGAVAAAGERLSFTAMEAAMLGEGAPARPVLTLPASTARDPLDLLRLASRPMRSWLGASRVRDVDGFLALPGARTFLLIFEAAPGLSDVPESRRFVAAVEDVLRDTRAAPDLGPLLESRRLTVVGRPVSRVSAITALQSDGLRVSAAGAALVLLLLALFYRSLLAPIVILVPVALGLALTGALAEATYGSVGVLAWMFTGILVGLGVDYGIHVCNQYWAHAAAAERESALVAALARPGAGLMAGAWTSAAGFLAMTLIPYPWTREVGVLAALGLVLILGCTFTVLPLLLSFSRPARTRESRFWSWAAEAVTAGRPAVAVAPWILLIGGAAASLPGLNFQAHPWRVLVRGNPEWAELDRLSTEAGTWFTPILVISTGATPEAALGRDREAMRRLRPVALQAGIATIRSPAQWLPDPEDQRANLAYVRANSELFSKSRIARDFAAIVARANAPDPYLTEEYLPRVLASLGSQLDEVTVADLRSLGLESEFDRYLWSSEGGHVAVSYIFLRRFPWAEGVMDRFMAVMQEAGLTDLPGVTLAGEPLRAPDPGATRRSVGSAALVAILLVAGILWHHFRSPSLVGLCLVPVVCGLSATVLAMRLLGFEFNLMSVAIAPILVGTGVDDGIHVVSRLREGQEVTAVLREAGSSLVMTTLTTLAAFASLALATFAGAREVGILGAIGMLTCLFASVHLVPLGWQWLGDPARPPTM